MSTLLRFQKPILQLVHLTTSVADTMLITFMAQAAVTKQFRTEITSATWWMDIYITHMTDIATTTDLLLSLKFSR